MHCLCSPIRYIIHFQIPFSLLHFNFDTALQQIDFKSWPIIYLFECFLLFHFLLAEIGKLSLFRIYEGFYDCSETVELSVKAQNKWLLSLVAIKTLRDLFKTYYRASTKIKYECILLGLHIIIHYYSAINPHLKDVSFIGFSCAYRTVIRLE